MEIALLRQTPTAKLHRPYHKPWHKTVVHNLITEIFSSCHVATSNNHIYGPVSMGLVRLKAPYVVLVAFIICCLSTQGKADPIVNCPTPCICMSSSKKLANVSNLLSINCSSIGLDLLLTDLWSRTNTTPTDISALTYSSDTNINNISLPLEDIRELTTTLQFLDMSYNQLASATWQDSLDDNMTAWHRRPVINVLLVDLSHNNIHMLGAEDLSVYRELRGIDLSYNHITDIDTSVFQHLQSLETIDLSHNKLHYLHNETFRSLANLHTLDLSHNRINGDSLNVILPELSSLQYLYVNDNKFTYADFPSATKLLILDMSNNNLTTVPSWKGFPALLKLNLSNNSINTLDIGSFSGLEKLQHLSLDNNPLSMQSNWVSKPVIKFSSHIRYSTVFSNLSHLQSLNLSHTPSLHFLPPTVFTPLVQLQVLDLSHSGLKHLSQLTFQQLSQLRHVFLAGNPFNCSCINAWLANIYTEGGSLVNSSVFSDRKLINCIQEDGSPAPMTVAADSCSEVMIENVTSTTSVHLGSQLHLQCHFKIDEATIIEWSTPRGVKLQLHPFHKQATMHLETPADVMPGAPYHQNHYWHQSTSYYSELFSSPGRVLLLSDGSLYVDYMLRSDAGAYTCSIRNINYNHSATLEVYLTYGISSKVKIYAIIVGLLCALTFFTLNLIYVIISWIARRLINKRRRKAIRQLLESLNAYKSTQMTRIYENYSHQLSRVRNQYHIQRDKLHKNYTHRVTRVKRGCSHQVDRVRDNYHSKLTTLSEYTSSQIVQIRERANHQIVRIRDYGSSQLERLRETYKLQHQHVMKLLDTMNLENCRHIVEAECMRTESMIFDIDLLGEDDDLRTESPVSEYDTATSTPSSLASSCCDKDSTFEIEDMDISDKHYFHICYPVEEILMKKTAEQEVGSFKQSQFSNPLSDEERREQMSDFGLHVGETDFDDLTETPLCRQECQPACQYQHRKRKKRRPNSSTSAIPLPTQIPAKPTTALPTLMSAKPSIPLPTESLPILNALPIRRHNIEDNTSSVDVTEFATPEASPTKTWSGGSQSLVFFNVDEANEAVASNDGYLPSVQASLPKSRDTNL